MSASVSGQVAPSETEFHNVEGFPKEADLAREVKSLPPLVMGKMIAPVIQPVTEAGQLLKCSIEHGRWKFMSRKDTYSIVDNSGDPFADGVHIKTFSNIIGKSRAVMYDTDEKPICLAVEETLAVNKHYNIYGRSPLIQGGAPEEKEDGIDFYPWFRVRDLDDNHLNYRSMLVWNGNNYQPLIRIRNAKRLPESPSPLLVPPSRKDNIIYDATDENKVYALISKRANQHVVGWDLCIAPGSDPTAMIMLAALMDDMVGWSLS